VRRILIVCLACTASPRIDYTAELLVPVGRGVASAAFVGLDDDTALHVTYTDADAMGAAKNPAVIHLDDGEAVFVEVTPSRCGGHCDAVEPTFDCEGLLSEHEIIRVISPSFIFSGDGGCVRDDGAMSGWLTDGSDAR